MIPHGVPIFVATTPVDMRYGLERLGGVVREKLAQDPRRRGLFVFVGKRGTLCKILTSDGTGIIVVAKRLDRGVFVLPTPLTADATHVVVSEALLAAFFAGDTRQPKSRRRIH